MCPGVSPSGDFEVAEILRMGHGKIIWMRHFHLAGIISSQSQRCLLGLAALATWMEATKQRSVHDHGMRDSRVISSRCREQRARKGKGLAVLSSSCEWHQLKGSKSQRLDWEIPLQKVRSTRYDQPLKPPNDATRLFRFDLLSMV